MAMAYFENITGKHVLVFPGLCKQHATGLCLKPVAVQLAMVSPCYCLASQMRGYHFHKLVEQGVRKSLQNKLRWIRSEEHPRWRPREQDVKHAKNVLELMYYHRDLRTSMDDESLAEQQKKRTRCGGDVEKNCWPIVVSVA